MNSNILLFSANAWTDFLSENNIIFQKSPPAIYARLLHKFVWIKKFCCSLQMLGPIFFLKIISFFQKSPPAIYARLLHKFEWIQKFCCSLNAGTDFRSENNIIFHKWIVSKIFLFSHMTAFTSILPLWQKLVRFERNFLEVFSYNLLTNHGGTFFIFQKNGRNRRGQTCEIYITYKDMQIWF